jgi:hypothetical protein
MYELDTMGLEILINFMYINQTYALYKDNRDPAGRLISKLIN